MTKNLSNNLKKAYSIESLETRIRNMMLEQISANTRDSVSEKHFDTYAGIKMTDSDLIHRVVSTGKDASCFTVSRDESLLYIQEAMYENMEDIVDWINDMSDGMDWEVYFDSDSPIGRGFYKSFYHTWNSGACDCSTIKVVLRKTYNADEFRIVTVYPIPTEAEKQECITRSKAYDMEHEAARYTKGRAKLYM